MNYIHNQLSKSSLKSSSSSRKSLTPSEEVPKLRSEINFLKEAIASLKLSLESKDVAIGTLAREKEKVFVELKTAQRTTRNLQQQLIDERDIHTKEKEYFKQEIQRLSTSYESYRDTNTDIKEVNMLRGELKSKDEVICNICSKYLKVKDNKNYLLKKLEKFERKSRKMCNKIIQLLEENRQTLNDLVNKIIHAASATPNSKRYLKLLRINANLHYENIQLKIELAHKAHSCDDLNIKEPAHISSEANLNKTSQSPFEDRKQKEYEPDFGKPYACPYSKSTYKIHERYHQKCSRNLFKYNHAKSIKRVYSDPCVYQ